MFISYSIYIGLIQLPININDLVIISHGARILALTAEAILSAGPVMGLKKNLWMWVRQ